MTEYTIRILLHNIYTCLFVCLQPLQLDILNHLFDRKETGHHSYPPQSVLNSYWRAIVNTVWNASGNGKYLHMPI